MKPADIKVEINLKRYSFDNTEAVKNLKRELKRRVAEILDAWVEKGWLKKIDDRKFEVEQEFMAASRKAMREHEL